MIADVTVSRTFTAGVLKGITLEQTWYEDMKRKNAPKIGDVWKRKEFTDTVISITPR